MIFLLGLLWGCLDQLEQHLPMLERFHCFELGRSWTDNMRNETDALDYLSDFALMVLHTTSTPCARSTNLDSTPAIVASCPQALTLQASIEQIFDVRDNCLQVNERRTPPVHAICLACATPCDLI
jgi:hypothetical protein